MLNPDRLEVRPPMCVSGVSCLSRHLYQAFYLLLFTGFLPRIFLSEFSGIRRMVNKGKLNASICLFFANS